MTLNFDYGNNFTPQNEKHYDHLLYVQGHSVKVPLLRLPDSANVDSALLRNVRDYIPVNNALRSTRHEFLANRR
jgi:hypothetical protein